ncbi:MAG: hypothetical protein B1H11_03250 [Desulfobacteraceae bacterium 4484_190.1]|nr:MAG: hypothetical protein B1H11_03250 [Desulfobacteraceae bacterium 4484_190.1]
MGFMDGYKKSYIDQVIGRLFGKKARKEVPKRMKVKQNLQTQKRPMRLSENALFPKLCVMLKKLSSKYQLYV